MDSSLKGMSDEEFAGIDFIEAEWEEAADGKKLSLVCRFFSG